MRRVGRVGQRVCEWAAARPGVGLAVTCAVALAAVFVLVGTVVLLHPAGATVGVSPSSDYQVMTWSLRWWPWALSHGVDPLHTRLLWPPFGFSTLWMTTIPVLSFVALPLTLGAGPLVAYNVLMLAAAPLAAGGAYLLCRELTGCFLPSVVGGLLFGLSPYMLGHLLSDHLDLVFVFPLPLLALLVVRLVRGKTSGRRFLVGFVALLLVVLGVSFELFLDLALMIAVGSVITFVGTRGRGAPIGRAIRFVLLAYGICLPVLVSVAALAFSAPHAPLRYAPSTFATDALNLIVPTPTVLLGRARVARRISEHFVSNIGEQDGYLGLPLLLIAVLAVRAYWRRGGWLLGGLLVVAVLLSLGPILTVGGRPWLGLPFAMSDLPLLAGALPARMSLFAALLAACLCALWLAQPGRGGLRVLVAIVVVVSVLPNFWAASRLPAAWSISNAFGWSRGHVANGFVSRGGWERVIRHGSTVLVLPTGDRAPASDWQAETAMRFKLAVPATPFVPPQLGSSPFLAGLVANDLPAFVSPAIAAARLRAFLIADHVSDVVVTSAAGSRWRQLVELAVAGSPTRVANAAVFRVPPHLRPLRMRSKPLVVRARLPGSDRGRTRHRRRFSLWLTFDGRRAHLHALLGGSSRQHAVVLSTAAGDVFFPAASVDSRGRAAVAFVELRRGKAVLRLATHEAGRWKVTALDMSGQPIWAPRVGLLADGAFFVAWVDERDPVRTLHAAVAAASGEVLQTTLETAVDIGSLVVASAGDQGVAAWSDVVAGEKRIRASILARGRWTGPTTVAASLDTLGYVRLKGADASVLRWLDTANPRYLRRFEATRRGKGWTAAHPAGDATRR
jgi:hypothetical protein